MDLKPDQPSNVADNTKVQRNDEPSSDERTIDEKPVEQASGHDTFPEGGARAWSVAFGAAGALFCTFGYANAFGVYQEYYEINQLHDQTPSAISWIGSIQIFFLFWGTLFGGPLFDQYGGMVLWPPSVTYVLSVMMTSLCKTYYQFFLAQGVLGGLSMGMIMAPAMAATGQYFHKNRGAAMGLAVAGSSLGGVIWPIALNKMLYNPRLGFGWAVRICGFIMVPLLALACASIRARLPPRKGKFFLPRAFMEIPYISLLFSVFLMLIGMFTPFFFLPTFAIEHGMSDSLSNYIIAILNGASFFGRVIPGILADKLGALNMLFCAGISTGILIECWPRTTTNGPIIVFAALYGFCSGAIISLMSVGLAKIPKDPRNIGTYMGMGMWVASFAALIGPPINGALVSRYHSFNQSAIFSGAFVLVGGFCVLLVKQASGKGIFGKV